MKRTCSRCWALKVIEFKIPTFYYTPHGEYTVGDPLFECLLGFKIEVFANKHTYLVKAKPSEQCPKLKTLRQMNKVMVEMVKKRDEVKK